MDWAASWPSRACATAKMGSQYGSELFPRSRLVSCLSTARRLATRAQTAVLQDFVACEDVVARVPLDCRMIAQKRERARVRNRRAWSERARHTSATLIADNLCFG